MLRNAEVEEWRQRCSGVTLQSDKEGHFGTFAGGVAAANPGLLAALGRLDTDEQRLLFVSQLHKVHRVFDTPMP